MSGLSVFTPPTIEPVTLAELKDHLRITDSGQDGLLAGYLLAARTHVEDFLGRSLQARTYDQKLDYCWPRDSCGSLRITLKRPPVISVTSVQYVDTAGATQPLSAGLYQVTESNGQAIIVPAFNSSWPTTRWQPDSITVRYVAGYGVLAGAIPEPIRQAILLLVGIWDENKSPVAIGNIVTDLPFTVRALLSPYQVEF